jgi:NAD(P)H-dependent flavin oxidoreductase YrpB (nitropropane dioxygenase family)
MTNSVDSTISFHPEAKASVHPVIIQGGMGVAVSGWQLARAVSRLGQLGVVSGTALDAVLVRRLQDGDAGGHVCRALEHFPFRPVVEAVLQKYFRPEGRGQNQPYKNAPMHTGLGNRTSRALIALGGFVEVFLAKEGHEGLVGINLLTKIQTHTLATLYGAMLAGVDYVLMGAGIPKDIPAVLDRFADGQEASIKLDVTGWDNPSKSPMLTFDLTEFELGHHSLERPKFLPIIASNLLATIMARKANGSVEGFVVEGPSAGGHNAPPRGAPTFDELGQPVYGEKDHVNLEQLADLGLPFWLAGGMGSPQALQTARSSGAVGIQVGTLFAYCQESGLQAEHKAAVLEQVRRERVHVLTDALASPTGFPFKVVNLPGSLADDTVYQARERICDLGYLREAYQKTDGSIGFRCAAEPVETYIAKGGKLEDTLGRKCLCNALTSDVGMGQIRHGNLEPALVTSGDDLVLLGEFLEQDTSGFTAKGVIDYLLGSPGFREKKLD